MKYTNRRKPPQKKTTSGSIMPMALLLVGAILIIFGLLVSYIGGNESAAYAEEDVATNRAILAVHEMGEGPSIPFLDKNGPQPAIAIPEDSYSFGSIGAKDIVTHDFIIRNEGDAPLTISRAYTTCGCTTAEISATIIEPGQVATVKIIFDAGFHEAGGQSVRRGLILENNDPRRSQAEIWIQADVRNS